MATPDRQTIDPTNAYEEQLKQLQVNMQQDQRALGLFNMRTSEKNEKWNDFVFGMYVNEQGRRQSFMTLADNVLSVQALGSAGVSNATLSSLTAEIAELKGKMNDVNEIVVAALRTGTPPAA